MRLHSNNTNRQLGTFTLTFLFAFSITLHLTLSKFVSYSLAPPRDIDDRSERPMTLVLLLLGTHAVVPLRLAITAASDRMEVFMALG